jgi:hypothetical protein
MSIATTRLQIIFAILYYLVHIYTYKHLAYTKHSDYILVFNAAYNRSSSIASVCITIYSNMRAFADWIMRMLIGTCTPNTLWFLLRLGPVMTLSGSQHTTKAQEFSETVTPRLKSLLLKSFKCFHIRIFF